MRGIYIALEGLQGSGKSALIVPLTEKLKLLYLGREIIATKEPDGPLRHKLKTETFSPIAEALIFAEARKYVVDGFVKPALDRGAIVISDRCYISSLACQVGKGVGFDIVREINSKFIETATPDIVVYLDVGLNVCVERSRQDSPDKFDREPLGYTQRTAVGYEKALKFLETLPNKPHIIRLRDPEGVIPVEGMKRLVLDQITPLIDGHFREGKVNRERS